ncbi:MAG: pyruvate, phosphate dikinase [Candidatus Kapabacteria bacterium]|nr:pyruvate, phosphate dikinase [Candidatus Kapabacteria bacterium]
MDNEVKYKILEKRAKELECLYKCREIVSSDVSFEEKIALILQSLPKAMQYPEHCFVTIRINDKSYPDIKLENTGLSYKSEIYFDNQTLGQIEVFYNSKEIKDEDNYFLDEEKNLIDTISALLSNLIVAQKINSHSISLLDLKTKKVSSTKPEWSSILELLRKIDKHLYSIISHKMLNHLFCKGIKETKVVYAKLGKIDDSESTLPEINRPSKKQVMQNTFELSDEIFDIALNYLNETEILNLIQKWINEDKLNYLFKIISSPNSTLSDITEAIRRFYHLSPFSFDTHSPVQKGIEVSLIRRFLNDQLEYINIAKDYCKIDDFNNLLDNLIYSSESHGKIGGKSAGIYLARKIIEGSTKNFPILEGIKTPKTWYITSDGLMSFVYYNNLEDAIEQKYKDMNEIRQEYQYLIQAFKNSNFPPEVVNGLTRALDDFGNSPIIVRSSSLLEDRLGTAFAGKYKSLFLANQGTRKNKLIALMDAIAEVYASVLGPDPIGYRIERGLLDFNEEMGIMIQEVVGKKVGNYFFPAFAGVSFTNNEFRWSPRIKREDGLIRLVAGLGTRAVDRIGNDYPILIAPGQPSFKLNQTYYDAINYSPKFIDVINLDTNSFETLPIKTVIEEVGNKFPMLNEIFSIVEENHIKKPVGLGIDTRKHEVIVTFDNLVSNTKVIEQIYTMTNVLSQKLKTPVDIEFASDGKNLYLLQCRPQSSTSESVSAIIPKDISKERIIFNANKFISNGKVPDITHIVYVVPEGYSAIKNLDDLKNVGRAIGKLNQILPPKQFILIGPGRWGSRGDITLGVRVTYADINNTAMLIEVAKQKGNYTPDLSFGTHFFQDLVESNIRYLPIYPDENGVIFRESFFLENHNLLPELLPEFEYLKNVIKVINVPASTKGLILKVLMNADSDEAMAFIAEPSLKIFYNTSNVSEINENSSEHWQIRTKMAEKLASELDPDYFGVKAVYLFGTTYNQTATFNSDIDLLIDFVGSEEQKKLLNVWLDAWDSALKDVIYELTGTKIHKLLDIYYFSSATVDKEDYFAQLSNPEKKLSKKLKLAESNKKL